MLISVAIDPTCFAPMSLASAEALADAERILEAVVENAVLLGSTVDGFIEELLSAVARLNTRFGQDIQLLVAEIAKNCDRHVAARLGKPTTSEETAADRLRRLATELRADIVVCSNSDDARQLADLSNTGIEVCVLSNYRRSSAEAQRRIWRSATRLDKLPHQESAEVLGRSIMFASEIIVVDKMIAKAAKEGVIRSQLERFARGVVYVADCWKRHSPHAAIVVPHFRIVSVAGGTGASAGFIDPVIAQRTIRGAIAETDKHGLVTSLAISLKQDRTPPIVADRFVAGLRRCWGVPHGVDDLGQLVGSRSHRRPTFLDPDCQDHRDLLAEILALPDAQ